MSRVSTALCLAIAMATNIALLVRNCRDDCDDCALRHICWQQFAGHWYPAVSILSLAYAIAHGPEAPPYQWIGHGMMLFGAFYILESLFVEGLEDPLPFRTIMHLAFTGGVGALGALRWAILRYAQFAAFRTDRVLFAALTLMTLVFVFNHPQPNLLGNWMHMQTSLFCVAFWVWFVYSRFRQAALALIATAVSFLFGQYGLTQIATIAKVGVVAYVAIVGVAMLVLWACVEAKAAPCCSKTDSEVGIAYGLPRAAEADGDFHDDIGWSESPLRGEDTS